MRLHRLLFIALFFLTACSSAVTEAVPTATTGVQPEVQPGAAYPAPQALNPVATSYPAAAQQTEVEPTVVRDPNKAVVQGRLLLNGAPVTDGFIYLSEVIKNNEGQEIVVGFERTSELRSSLDANGNFSIVNIPPGRYGFVYDLVSDAFLLMTPGKEESFIVDVAAGQDINLGDLNYPVLPTR